VSAGRPARQRCQSLASARGQPDPRPKRAEGRNVQNRVKEIVSMQSCQENCFWSMADCHCVPFVLGSCPPWQKNLQMERTPCTLRDGIISSVEGRSPLVRCSPPEREEQDGGREAGTARARAGTSPDMASFTGMMRRTRIDIHVQKKTLSKNRGQPTLCSTQASVGRSLRDVPGGC